LAGLFVVLTIILGLGFILNILDPNRYEKQAKTLLQEEEKKITSPGDTVGVGDFMDSFVILEKRIRSLLPHLSMFETGSARPWPRTLTEIVNLLNREELIDGKEADQLREITKVRNLVVHGEKTEISREWLNKISEVTRILGNVERQISERGLSRN
jgi:hypothetical protein